MNEEYLLKLSMLEEEGKRLEEQIQIINQQLAEFQILKKSLEKINNNEEILANLGKGVFVKSTIKEKKLFVNVGSGIVLRKTGEETIKLIEKQEKELEKMKQELLEQIEKINLSLQEIVREAKKH